MKFVGTLKLIGTTLGAIVGYSIADYLATEQPYKAPKPICGCGHHMSMHDDNGCHNRTMKKLVTERGKPRKDVDDLGYVTEVYDMEKFDYVPEECGCRQYMGPNPDIIVPDRASFKKH